MILHKNRGEFIEKPKSMRILVYNLVVLSLLLSIEPFRDMLFWNEIEINYYNVFTRITLSIVMLVLTYFYSQYSRVARLILILGMIVSLLNYEQHLIPFIYVSLILFFNPSLTILLLFLFYGFIVITIVGFLYLNLFDKTTKLNFSRIVSSDNP